VAGSSETSATIQWLKWQLQPLLSYQVVFAAVLGEEGVELNLSLLEDFRASLPNPIVGVFH
jgi:hypothetical protein